MITEGTEKKERVHRILQVRRLTDAASVIRIERGCIDFEPGQYLRIGMNNSRELRDYSIYSGRNENNYLEVLVRRVGSGMVSKQICDLSPGAPLTIQGPLGVFCLPENVQEDPLLFVATGTGISPFHSMITSHPTLNYRLLHGTSRLDEAYESGIYGSNYFHCVSRENGGPFKGRVTDYLKTLSIAPETHVFLCGNCDMIYDAFDLLREKKTPSSHIHTEVYF